MSEKVKNASTPWWVDLFSLCRPGTRTVLDHPENADTVVEFARRGYRLHVLHHRSFDLEGLRQRLRSLGLGSQLMGSSVVTRQADPKLTRRFYEGWIVLTSSPPASSETLLDSLQPGSCIYGLTEGCWFWDWGSPVERVPPHITVRRTGSSEEPQSVKEPH